MNDYLMYCSGGSKVKTDPTYKIFKEKGLCLEGHAYGVLGCATVKDSKGCEARIVHIRNPWGW